MSNPFASGRQNENPFPYVKESTWKLARKRLEKTQFLGPKDGQLKFLVEGQCELKDSYADYYVSFDSSRELKWLCSCNEHRPIGQRRVCSHLLAAYLVYQGLTEEEKHVPAGSGRVCSGTEESPVQAQENRPRDSAGELRSRVEDSIGPSVPISANDQGSPVPVDGGQAAGTDAGLGGQQLPQTGTGHDAQPVPGGPASHYRAARELPAYLNSDDPPPLTTWDLPAKFHTEYAQQQFVERGQWPIIRQIVNAYISGFRWVFLRAPVGSGKTLIGEIVRQIVLKLWWREDAVGRRRQGIYCCNTLDLLDQVCNDFPYAALISGKANWPTLNYPERFNSTDWQRKITCADCEIRTGNLSCRFCQDDFDPNAHLRRCPYKVARRNALLSPFTVATTAYMLACWNYTDSFRDAEIVILDEGDKLETEGMKFHGIEFSKKFCQDWQLGEPQVKSATYSWLQWCRDAADRVDSALARVFEQIERDNSIQNFRNARALERAQGDLHRLERCLTLQLQVEQGDLPPEQLQTRFVYISKEPGVTFKPVTVEREMQDILWRHGQRFLMMSGTFVSCEMQARFLGIPDGWWTEITMKSTFPPERRKIYAVGGARNIHDNRNVAWPHNAVKAWDIFSRFPQHRGIIHTASYDEAKYIFNYLRGALQGRTVLTWEQGNSQSKRHQLEVYKATPSAILVGPGLNRGTDLPDDLGRIQILTKILYPNKTDEQVAYRLHGCGRAGQIWYDIQAIQEVAQAPGRTTRHNWDWGLTWILDDEFFTLWRRFQDAFPPDFREAVYFNDYGFWEPLPERPQ